MSRHAKTMHRSFAGGEMSVSMYSRPDDGRTQSGAALLQNILCKPTGAAMRRPGLELVREVKDSALGQRVRLIPFALSLGDTFEIEAGRATIDSREIGYMRFHTGGSTLLYDLPAIYVAPRGTTFATSSTVTASSSHGLTTGDPVVHTMSPSVAVTIDTATDEVLLASANTLLGHGTPVIFSSATAPTTSTGYALETSRIYYAYLPSATGFRVSEVRFGAPYDFATAGATVLQASMPTPSGRWLGTDTVLFARVITVTTYSLHDSAADAAANVNAVTFVYAGNGDRRLHKAYEPGDLIYWNGTGVGPFSCIRRPWTTPLLAGRYCFPDDHVDHSPPGLTNYWCRVAGSYKSTATADATTDRITWTAHGVQNGDPLIIGGSPVPAPLSSGDVVYARSVTADTFEVSLTPFGPRLDITVGSGTVTVFANSFYEVPHYYTETDLFRLSIAQSNDVLSLAVNTRPFAELRRISASRWRLDDVRFGALVPAPSNLVCASPYRGQAMQVTVTNTLTPSLLTAVSIHNFADNETVYVTGLSAQDIDDGHYVIHGSTSPGLTLYLADLITGAAKAAIGTGGTGYIQSSLSVVDTTNVYAVTSVDVTGAESPISNELSVTNNLYVQGAYNQLTWFEVTGASRYRIYKSVSGLFGLIGESTVPSFTDDNIAPDLSISPPEIDDTLMREALVSINVSGSLFSWTAHGLPNGTPIVFFNNYSSASGLPGGLVEGTTYYLINGGPNSFQVAASPTSSTPITLSGTAFAQTIARAGAFPGTVSYFEGRRALGGSVTLPQDIWMTASGTESDMSFSLPTVDSDRIQFRLALRYETPQVRHIVPMAHLLLLAAGSEIRVTPVNDDVLTPTSVSSRPQSYVGSDYPQPAIVNSTVIFAAARGGHVRELGYNADSLSYLTGDLSLRAAHLFDGYRITQLAYAKAPTPLLWFVSSSGKLLGLTYIPEEQVGAWHQHVTDGTFESVVTTPSEEEDRTSVAVKRELAVATAGAFVTGKRYKIRSVGTTNFTLIGATENTVGVEFVASGAGSGTGTAALVKRFVERFKPQAFDELEDYFGVDCGVSYSGAATTSVFVPHLAGLPVSYLANGVVGSGTVSAAGVLTLATAATLVHIGLPYTVEVQTLPMALQTDAFGSGKTKNPNGVWVRVERSGAFRVGPSTSQLVSSQRPASGQLLTELIPVTVPGTWSDEGQLVIRQTDPLPLTVIGLTIEVPTGG